MIDMHVTCFAVLTCCFAKGISGRFSVPVQQCLFISYLRSFCAEDTAAFTLYNFLGYFYFLTSTDGLKQSRI